MYMVCTSQTHFYSFKFEHIFPLNSKKIFSWHKIENFFVASTCFLLKQQDSIWVLQVVPTSWFIMVCKSHKILWILWFVLLACHKKSYLISVEFSNFWILRNTCWLSKFCKLKNNQNKYYEIFRKFEYSCSSLLLDSYSDKKLVLSNLISLAI